MCEEVGLGSLDFDEFDGLDQLSFPKNLQPAENLSETIFPWNHCCQFTKNTVLYQPRLEITQRIQKISHHSKVAPMGRVSGEIGVTYEWGGDKEEGSVSGYITGSAEDNNGNTASVEVQVNNDGSGSVNVSASHEEDTNS